MLFPKVFVAIFLTMSCVSAFPSSGAQVRAIEKEVHENSMSETGKAADAAMAQREVDFTMRRDAQNLISRIHVECSTILPTCQSNSECKKKSIECGGCNLSTHKCVYGYDAARPAPPQPPRGGSQRGGSSSNGRQRTHG